MKLNQSNIKIFNVIFIIVILVVMYCLTITDFGNFVGQMKNTNSQRGFRTQLFTYIIVFIPMLFIIDFIYKLSGIEQKIKVNLLKINMVGVSLFCILFIVLKNSGKL